MVIQSRGQTRLFGEVVLNVALNYLPKELIQSANDCRNNCNDVLNVTIIKGFNGAQSITSRYIPLTSYIFSVEVNFGKEPIGAFTVQIAINQKLRTQYFSGVDISQTLQLDINPAYLAIVNSPTEDVLS